MSELSPDERGFVMEIHSGEYFGEAFMLMPWVSYTSVVAKSFCEVLKLSKQRFDVLANDPQLISKGFFYFLFSYIFDFGFWFLVLLST